MNSASHVCGNKVLVALIPDFVRVQYAGSVGLFNVGFGWEYGRHKQWETDLMVGYVPKYSTDKEKFTLTLRQSYVPLTTKVGKCANYENPSQPATSHSVITSILLRNMSFQPFVCGMFLNTIFGDEFWLKEPSCDRGSRYRFSSMLRAHIFIGQRVIFTSSPNNHFPLKTLAFVWELSTCDLYIATKMVNKSVPFSDILSLSLGLKIGL